MMRSAKYAIAALALVAPLAIAPTAQAQDTYCSQIFGETFTVGGGGFGWLVLSGSAPVTGVLFNANTQTTAQPLIATAMQDVGANIWIDNFNPFPNIVVTSNGWDVITYEC
jgi:hypothetical protein